MKCKHCDNESQNIIIETDEKFEVLSINSSQSNWDEWDLIANIKCKECNNIFEFCQ